MPLQMQKKANPKGSRTPSVQRLKARKKKGSALADVRTPPKRGADDAVPPSLSHMRLSFPYLIRSACAHGLPITPRCEPYAPATSPSLSLLFPKAPSLTWNGTLGFTQGQVAVVQAEDGRRGHREGGNGHPHQPLPTCPPASSFAGETWQTIKRKT